MIKLRFREDLSTLWIEVSRREKAVPLHLLDRTYRWLLWFTGATFGQLVSSVADPSRSIVPWDRVVSSAGLDAVKICGVK